ncbi:MAG TPA: phosphate ABC transporter permease subunit PstC [Bacteroidales bacterium]|nr:phosphate ABC transporter permease subunit PstC [Bacteroidales bacterium]HPS49064.1 phosphate ABC transporter permease subunit PstC [Bacteroidales bacterium]
MNQNTEKKKFVFTKESLKKKFRISEFLSEKIITSVAFLSIAIIILIFFFVFRETMPIFKSQTAVESQPATAMVQEQYGVDSSLILNDQGQEQYGVDSTVMVNANGQEQYGVTESGLQDTGEVSSTENAAGSEHEVAVLKSLVGKDWLPVSDHPRYGLIPLFVGTLKITLLAILFAAPIAILAALFTAAFAPNWLREIIKPAIELLAGFPSVVIGFFALMVMASFFQGIFGYESRLNAFVGGIAMALAAIPIIYTITEDALTAIPASYKEASLALGATKWQTALFVTLPAATPGIFAAILLGIGRVFGETMIALMATGNAAMTSANPFESVRTLAATIGAEMAEVVFGDTHYSVLFLIGSLLFIFTFGLNALAEFYIKGKLVRRFQGKS